MNKITYKLANLLFTLRKYKQGNLCHESYPIPMLSTLRSAIIGSIIKVDGVEKAEELFYKVKNEVIYIQYPEDYFYTNQRLKRCSNSYYTINDETDITKWSSFYTMGCKQFIGMDKIVFYIGNNIPNIESYLKNIDWIGSADSLVYLDSIEQINELKNILVPWDKKEDTDIYEVYDWNKVSNKTKFKNIYLFSDKYRRTDVRELCCIKDIILK